MLTSCRPILSRSQVQDFEKKSSEPVLIPESKLIYVESTSGHSRIRRSMSDLLACFRFPPECDPFGNSNLDHNVKG